MAEQDVDIVTIEDGWAYSEMRQHWWKEPKAAPLKSLVAYFPSKADASQLESVGVLRLWDAALELEGIRFTALCIGWVFVSEKERSKGICTALLDTLDHFVNFHDQKMWPQCTEARQLIFGNQNRIVPALILYNKRGGVYQRAGFEKIAMTVHGDLWAKSLVPGLDFAPGNWRVTPEEHL